jgi:putative nucleotidyltransferase with HDIG domain
VTDADHGQLPAAALGDVVYNTDCGSITVVEDTAAVTDAQSPKLDSASRPATGDRTRTWGDTPSALPGTAAKGHAEPAQLRFRSSPTFGRSVRRSLANVNKELWLILSMLAIAGVMNYIITAHRMILGLYTFPTLFSAYYFGRRHATLTAFASLSLVALLLRTNPNLLAVNPQIGLLIGRWYDVIAWGAILVLTAYAMGTLYERNRTRVSELRQTYRGLLLILRQFLSNDKYTENHSYRVSVYAAAIAARMGFSGERTEDVRAASLLHDIGKIETSRDLLYKAARLSEQEYERMKKHVDRSARILDPVEGPLHRILPIVLAHHDRYDGSGYRPNSGNDIPLEARIIAVADAYDAMTSDRPYRRAMSPFDAKETITRASGTQFDPEVVDAFLEAFGRNEMEIPELVL